MKKPRPCPVCQSSPADAAVLGVHRGRPFDLYVRRCPAYHLSGGNSVSRATAALSWDNAVRRFLALRRIVNLLRSQSS